MWVSSTAVLSLHTVAKKKIMSPSGRSSPSRIHRDATTCRAASARFDNLVDELDVALLLEIAEIEAGGGEMVGRHEPTELDTRWHETPLG